MRIALSYSTIPAYGEPSSLHFQYDISINQRAALWIHVPGQTYSDNSSRPWWLDYGEQGSDPEWLNEQTTRIIVNLARGLRLEAVPDAAPDNQGDLKELEFLAGINRVKYVWCQTLPPQWQDFGSLLAFFDGFIEARIEARSGAS